MGKVQKEIWKDIAGFEGRYQVSSKSRVRFLGGYSKKYSLRGRGFTHRAISTLYSVTPEAIGWVLKNKKI